MSSLKLLRGSFNKLSIKHLVPRTAVSVCSFASKSGDVPIHTGQKWDADDYRMVRFTNAPKHVNPNWAVKLIDEVPPKACTERVISCDGGGGPTGHPKVFINLDKPGNHACGYCGLRFFKDTHHH